MYGEVVESCASRDGQEVQNARSNPAESNSAESNSAESNSANDRGVAQCAGATGDPEFSSGFGFLPGPRRPGTPPELSPASVQRIRGNSRPSRPPPRRSAVIRPGAQFSGWRVVRFRSCAGIPPSGRSGWKRGPRRSSPGPGASLFLLQTGSSSAPPGSCR